jgi:hypothetical protein
MPDTSEEKPLPQNFSRQCTIHSLCLKGGGKWMAELEEPRERHHLGLVVDDVHCAAAS